MDDIGQTRESKIAQIKAILGIGDDLVVGAECRYETEESPSILTVLDAIVSTNMGTEWENDSSAQGRLGIRTLHNGVRVALQHNGTEFFTARVMD